MVSSHTDHYQLWHDAHRENHMQWVELKGIKERLARLDEQIAAVHLKDEECHRGIFFAFFGHFSTLVIPISYLFLTYLMHFLL